jgi:hypothetical protein
MTQPTMSHWDEEAVKIITCSLPARDIECNVETSRWTKKAMRLRGRIAKALRAAYENGQYAGVEE